MSPVAIPAVRIRSGRRGLEAAETLAVSVQVHNRRPQVVVVDCGGYLHEADGSRLPRRVLVEGEVGLEYDAHRAAGSAFRDPDTDL